MINSSFFAVCSSFTVRSSRWRVWCIQVLCLGLAAVSSQSALSQTTLQAPTSAPTPTVPQAPTPYAQNTAPAPSLPQLRAQLETLEKQLQNREIPADVQNLALLRFKLEQSRLILFYLDNGMALSPEQALGTLSAYVQRSQEVARAKSDAAHVANFPMHERAYIAANDDSAQPYWIFLPKNYSPRQKYPVVVFLHGYSPFISKVDPWLPDDQTWQLATNRGFILAVPYGRRNSDFVDIGEDDTLKVLEEVQKKYSVDATRTYLMGPSMGGFGVYAVGLHRPDLWAGLAPMSARSDMYLWFNLQREQVPAWKRLQYDADDPRFLKRNSLYLPILLQHGALDDIVPVEHSRRLAADLKTLGYPARYREISDGDHYIYFGAAAYETAFDWMRPLRRIAAPRRVVYTSGNPRNEGAYWVKITARDDYGRAADIDANIKTNNEIVVQMDNVAAFTLTPPAQYLQAQQPLSLVVNGKKQPMSFDKSKPIEWRSVALQNVSLTDSSKTPLRGGPIKNCYRDPFLVVYGTKGADNDVNEEQAKAQRWVQEWTAYADGVPPMKADTQVTSADRENYNLILFGTRDNNHIIAEIADKLPLELTAKGYRRGTKYFDAANIGLQMCYASPFSQQRMIVVQSGQPWGEALTINHKFDLLPDYIIFDNSREADDTNRALRAGYFDHQWQLPAEDKDLSPTLANHNASPNTTAPETNAPVVPAANITAE
jgi:predicted esterase